MRENGAWIVRILIMIRISYLQSVFYVFYEYNFAYKPYKWMITESKPRFFAENETEDKNQTSAICYKNSLWFIYMYIGGQHTMSVSTQWVCVRDSASVRVLLWVISVVFSITNWQMHSFSWQMCSFLLQDYCCPINYVCFCCWTTFTLEIMHLCWGTEHVQT